MPTLDDPGDLHPELGPLEAEFRTSGCGRCFMGCLGVVCVLLGVTFLIALVAMVISGTPGRAIGIIVFGLAFLAGGVALIAGFRTAGRTSVRVYRGGLILKEEENSETCRWDEIVTVIEKEAVDAEEVVAEAMNHESRAFRLHLASGQVIVLKSYISGLAKLGALIKERSLPYLLPRYREELNQSGAVTFGPIQVTAEGVQVGGEGQPWGALGEIRRRGGWIVFARRTGWGTWQKVKLSEVADAHILLELVGQLRPG